MALSKIDVGNMLDDEIRRPNAQSLIINGSMAVAQRDTSVTGITGDGYKLCDRWYEYLSSLGTYTFAQEAQTSGNAFDNGFRTAFRIDCTTADASPSASDEFWWGMKFEGQNLQLIKKGTSNAQKLTLAFWVKSNKTGVGQVNFRDTDNSRMCSGTYTISSADTWEHKIINIAADTTGSFNNDNAESLQIQWYLDSGSNYEGGTAPTAWEADSATDRNASGTLNIGDNTANDWSITGVQLEVGEYTSSTLPPFQHESYGDNLFRCQRYYNIFGNATGKPIGMAAFYTASAAYCGPLVYPVEMRSSPTISITGGSGDAEATAGYAINHSAQNDWFQTFSSSATSTKECQVYVSSGVSATDGDAGRCKIGDSEANKGKIEASAEL
jgi:hypothetical protein